MPEGAVALRRPGKLKANIDWDQIAQTTSTLR
jgi:hypothetical protein